MSRQSQFHQEIQTILQGHLKDDLTPLLNSSKDQDIVVLLGKTGSGKSTLVNYLTNKDMFITKDEEFQLRNPDEPSVMKIGMGGISETLIPKSGQIGSLIFYDLPGIGDNRGPAVDLVNASFIKHIIENARTVRIVFVAGQDEITASRGDSLKNLLKISKTLIPHHDAILKSSIFVITKSLKDTPEEMIEYLNQRINGTESMKVWLKPDRIQPMSKRIDQQQKKNIIEKIKMITPSKITSVNIEAIFSTDVRNDLKNIFESEMTNSLENIYGTYPKKQSNIAETNESILFFKNSFLREVISELNNSTMIGILKPLSNKIYHEEVNKLTHDVKAKIVLSITQLNLRKSELVQEEQRKLAEEQLRLQLIKIETQRLAQIKLEEENKRKQDLLDEQNRQIEQQKENQRLAQIAYQEELEYQEKCRMIEQEKLSVFENWPTTKQFKTEVIRTYWSRIYGQSVDIYMMSKSKYESLIEISVRKWRQVRIQPITGYVVILQDWTIGSTWYIGKGQTRLIEQ